MENLNSEKVVAFVRELAELTRKHKVSISGCGCCGSPRLTESVEDYNAEAGYSVEENQCLNWVSPDHAYNWKLHKDHIVR